MKRKIKVHGKIKIFETSAVGIPAYPNAHASAEDFSLIKSAKSAFVDEVEDIPYQNVAAEKSPHNQEVKNNMSEQEKSASISEVKETKEIAKSVDMDALKSVLIEAVKTGLKEAQTERGLVSTEEKLKAKSLGEALLDSGVFKAY